MTAPRAAGIDLVRVIGIAAVVFGHVYAGPATHNYVYAWHVPVFFFLTGYLWSHGRSVGVEASKRWRTLGMPYVGWFIAITVCVVVIAGAIPPLSAFVGPLLGGANAGGAYGTFWFVGALFFTAILYRLIDRAPRAVIWAAAVAGLAAGYLWGDVLAATPLAVGSALPCLFFAVAGTEARRLERSIPIPAAVGAALIVAPLAIIYLTHLTTIDIKHGQYGTPVVGVILACSISFGLVLVAQSIRYPRPIADAVTELAVVGIAVVLLHPFVLVAVIPFAFPKPIVLALALLIPWGLALLLHRTFLSRLLIGAPPRTWTRERASQS